MLKKGQKAPAFKLKDSTGQDRSLTDFQGKKVILYFYPKDDTPGCTKESIAFSQAIESIQDQNAVVIGISKDSVASHAKFINKYDLNVILLSDPELDACQAYGVWQEKKNYGRSYMGIVRTTFLIDENGHIYEIWEKVKVDGHVEAVCDAI